MLRLHLLCSLITGLGLASLACGSDTITEQPPRMVRYSGTVNQPAAGGFLVYRIAGSWTLNPDGSLLSGTDTVQILDAKVYGQSGTALMVLKTKCVAIVGKDAWSQAEVVASSDSQGFPIGTVSVLRLSLANGTPKGGGGPHDIWYPAGNVCVDKPAAMPAFDLQNGVLTFP
ncbi:MAG: hypothetical protein ABJE47_20495 [bacterium]